MFFITKSIESGNPYLYTLSMDSVVVSANFDLWKTALLSRKPQSVAALYTKNATLLPTMGQKVITNSEGIEAYFTFFLAFLPSVSILEEHVMDIAELSYLHCGMYRFNLTIEGETEQVDARFSIVWQKIHGEWKIFHHHSSRVPDVRIN